MFKMKPSQRDACDDSQVQVELVNVRKAKRANPGDQSDQNIWDGLGTSPGELNCDGASLTAY